VELSEDASAEVVVVVPLATVLMVLTMALTMDLITDLITDPMDSMDLTMDSTTDPIADTASVEDSEVALEGDLEDSEDEEDLGCEEGSHTDALAQQACQ